MSRRLADTVAFGVHRVLSLPVTLPLPRMVAALNDYQPDFLNCYPSIGVLLAAEQEAGRLRIAPSGMSTSSELRSPEATARIEAAFGVKPTDMYATTEGLWGATCPEHGAMHLFDDTCIVENLGDRLLVTNLYNRAQPLIRFELTDVMAFAGEPCPCGRSLTRVESIEGRAADVLDLPGARGGRVAVHPMQFGVVTADPAVREFQVVGRDDRLLLRVVLRDGADTDAAVERLRDRVCERLSAAGVDSPAVEVELHEELERSPAGKLPVVVAG
jgi:phenylacetate-coenzyme A ligase PaaK-like adenylate-forming protein